MKSHRLMTFVLAGIVSISQVPLSAQARPAQQAATSVARAAQVQLPVVPTGALTSTTKAAAAVRASRIAQANAARGATQAGANAAARSTSVMGYLWTANNAAIPDATVQLRNTLTGQIEMFTKSNGAGEFLFNNVDAGSYVIEYASDAAASNLLALGHPFTVAPGETVATFVRLSNALPMVLPDLAGNVAASAVQAAASAGVTTVISPIAPVVNQPPPGTPPSPQPAPPPASSVR